MYQAAKSRQVPQTTPANTVLFYDRIPQSNNARPRKNLEALSKLFTQDIGVRLMERLRHTSTSTCDLDTVINNGRDYFGIIALADAKGMNTFGTVLEMLRQDGWDANKSLLLVPRGAGTQEITTPYVEIAPNGYIAQETNVGIVHAIQNMYRANNR